MRYLVPLLGLAAGVGIFIALLALEVAHILPGHVVPVGGEEMDDWIDGFKAAELLYVFYPAIGCAIIWHLISLLKPSYKGDQRTAWFILWGVAALAAILCVTFKVPHEEGGISSWPTLITILNGVLIFWVSTAPFTTATHKFAPFLSSALRKLY